MKWKKSRSIGNEAEKRSTWCIGKVMEMSMTNGSQNQGCLIQRRQLKITKQGVQVKTYKEGG